MIRSDSDRVDDLMDSMQDEKEIHDQISNAISRGYGDAMDEVSSKRRCTIIIIKLLYITMEYSYLVSSIYADLSPIITYNCFIRFQDELEQELEELLALDLQESEAAAAKTVYMAPPEPSLNLPSVPTTVLPKVIRLFSLALSLLSLHL